MAQPASQPMMMGGSGPTGGNAYAMMQQQQQQQMMMMMAQQQQMQAMNMMGSMPAPGFAFASPTASMASNPSRSQHTAPKADAFDFVQTELAKGGK
jgi:hypothetical protein